MNTEVSKNLDDASDQLMLHKASQRQKLKLELKTHLESLRKLKVKRKIKRKSKKKYIYDYRKQKQNIQYKMPDVLGDIMTDKTPSI